MAIVPTTVGMADTSGVANSPMAQQSNQQVAPKNLLMAAAVMHHLGRLKQPPAPRMSQKKTQTSTGPA
jgi:hypothetical protein